MGAFAAAIFVMLVLVFFSANNCGWGLAIGVVLQISLAIFFFTFSAGIAIGLVVLSDSCQNSETILVQFSPLQFKGLVR